MYIYIYIYTYICVYIYISFIYYTHIHIYKHMYVCIHTYIWHQCIYQRGARGEHISWFYLTSPFSLLHICFSFCSVGKIPIWSPSQSPSCTRAYVRTCICGVRTYVHMCLHISSTNQAIVCWALRRVKWPVSACLCKPMVWRHITQIIFRGGSRRCD